MALKSYDKAEEKERNVLIEVMEKVLRPKRYSLSPVGSAEVWDFTVTYTDARYLGEIKCRSFPSGKYDCIFLEERKAKNLIFAGFKMDIYNPPLYLSHYTDGIVYCLKLSPVLLTYYPTCWKTINGIRKRVYLIPVSEANKFEL